MVVIDCAIGSSNTYAKLKVLEDENGKLKKLLVEQMRDNAMLKDVNSKNGDARSQAEKRWFICVISTG
jgi:hypothetical protein